MGRKVRSTPGEAVSSSAGDLLQAAFRLHQSGQLGEAERAYREVLAQNPSEHNSLTNLGTIFLQRGDAEEGLRLLDASLAVRPNQANALANRGNALLRLGRHEDALASLDRALAEHPANPNALRDRAKAAQALGRADDAIRDFGRALALQPHDAGELLEEQGTLLLNGGRHVEALAALEEAVRLNPHSSRAWNNLSVALGALDRHNEAIVACDRAIELKSDYAEAFNNRGNALKAVARPKDALAAYERALELAPNSPAAQNLCLAFAALGQLEEALAAADAAIARNPDSAALWTNRGAILELAERWEDALASHQHAASLQSDDAAALQKCGVPLVHLERLDEALGVYGRVLELEPGRPSALAGLGAVLHRLQRFDEALAAYDEALGRDPGDLTALQNRFVVLGDLGRFEEAQAASDAALELLPLDADTWNNRGVLLQQMGRLEPALSALDRSLGLKPAASTWINRGVLLQRLGRFQEAHAAFVEASSLGIAKAQAQWFEGMLLILQGDHDAGWRLYERRLDYKKLFNLRHLTRPMWNGVEPLSSKTLLLHWEQGLGDSLQMLRYAPVLAGQGARVVLSVQAPLVGLARSVAGVSEVAAAGEPLPEHDLVCMLMSLPHLLGTNEATIPAQVPYLSASPADLARWRRRLGERPRLRIGLAWSGSATHKNDHNRSLALARLAPLLDLEASFVSLQKEYRPDDLAFLQADGRIADYSAELESFGDTAALIEQMDLVVSVDTSVAHLAGALGKPLRLLLPHLPDFRWGLQRTDSPWYPTARLLRQSRAGDWLDTIDRLKAELAAQLATTPAAAERPGASARLQEALRLHQQGRLEAAEDLYRQVLQANPSDHNALTNLGTICIQRGDAEGGLSWLDASLAIRPSQANAHANRGNALLRLRRFEEALAALDEAIALDATNPKPFGDRGRALRELGRLDDAVTDFTRALELRPKESDLLCERGGALLALGRHAEALANLEQAVQLEPKLPSAWNNLAVALGGLDRHEEALAACDQALIFKADYPDAFNNRGNALKTLGRTEEALAAYDRAIELVPDYLPAFQNRCLALSALGRVEEALAASDAALALDPNLAATWSNRGVILQLSERLDEAIAAYGKAAELDPMADASWFQGMLVILKGDFEAGWRLYERRLKDGKLFNLRHLTRPMWNGVEPLSGKTLLLHWEQGLGDTLQMLRYAPVLAERGARVVLSVQAPLVGLARSVAGVSEVAASGEPLPEHDLVCMLMSLPHALGTTEATIPAQVPYLAASPADLARWRRRLGKASRPRIGLAWSGSATHKNDHNRSLALATLAPLLDLEASFVSLQKEYRPDDLAFLQADGRIADYSAELESFGDTAALIEQMDLVVSVDTSVAHLAGALGNPLRLLLPHLPDFRWGLQRTDSPWYPTARLLRQSRAGDWLDTIDRLKTELGRL